MTANRKSAQSPQSDHALTVRRATMSDAAAIWEISTDMVFQCDTTKFVHYLGELLDNPGDEVFVACSGVTLTGWVHVFVARRVGAAAFAEIGGLVTSEQFRCRGVGRALVQECESWAMRNLMARLRVRSNTQRVGAHAFYGKTGFTRLKDQVVYEKIL